MNNTTVNSLFGSSLRVKILGWFFLHTEERYYVRQLARLIKDDLANLCRELNKLEQLGLLISNKQGNIKYYSINKTNPIFSELKGIMIKSVGLGNLIKDALTNSKSKIKYAFIYGSFAKDKQNISSDIDLLIIGSITYAEVTKILKPVEHKIAREINPVVMDNEEMKVRLHNQEHFFTTVIKEPKIWLIGDEIEFKRLVK